MQTRLSSVQQALLVLIASALMIAVVARPAPQNARLRRALDELTVFSAQFDRTALERALLESALAQGRQPVSAVADAVSGIRPNVGVDASVQPAPTIEPFGTLRLATLADAQAFSEPGRTLTISVAQADVLGRALAWRLQRDVPADAPVLLQSVALRPARVNQADLEREVEVGRLSAERASAGAEVAAASEELAKAEHVYETRRKWKWSWKLLVKPNEERKQAKTALTDKQRTLTKLEKRYAEAVRATEHAYPALDSAVPESAVARVSLTYAGTQRAYEIPVPLRLQQVPLQSLKGSELPETRSSGLWDEVKDLDAAAAIDAVRARFNWHYRYVELSGIKLGGMTVLQLVPCVLPLILGFSLLRMRAVSEAYNPFTMRVRGSLPRIGFGSRILDAIALVILPLAAAVSAVASLLLIGQVPAIPVLTGVIGLLLGVYAFLKLGELKSLMEDVVRSHSNPPPDE